MKFHQRRFVDEAGHGASGHVATLGRRHIVVDVDDECIDGSSERFDVGENLDDARKPLDLAVSRSIGLSAHTWARTRAGMRRRRAGCWPCPRLPVTSGSSYPTVSSNWVRARPWGLCVHGPDE